jgi:hypothetical protein
MTLTAKLWHLNPDCTPVGFQRLFSYQAQKQTLVANAASDTLGSNRTFAAHGGKVSSADETDLMYETHQQSS